MITLKQKNIVQVLLLMALVLSTMTAHATFTGGEPSVDLGDTEPYTFNDGNMYIGYRWEVSKGAKIDSSKVGTAYNLTVTWNEPGTGKIEFKAIVGGTLTTIDDLFVTIALPQPTVNVNGSTTMDLGDSRTLSTPGTYDSYQWLKNGVELSGETTSSLTIYEAGSYELRGTTSGTSSTSTPVEIQYSLLAQNYNLVRTVNVLESGVMDESGFGSANDDNLRQSVTYFDGLGRPIQTVLKEESPGSFDVVQHIEYDDFGRQQKNYTPYTLEPSSILGSSDGTYKSTADVDQPVFSNDLYGGSNGDYAFSETDYEQSPLSRVLKTYAPGQPWSKTGGNKPVEYQYLVSEAADNVFQWDIKNETLVAYSYYEAGSLFKNVTLDENTGSDQGEVIEFKDKQGRVVLKRVKKDASDYLDTYYVYDDFGNLRFVVPPKAASSYVAEDLTAPEGYNLVTEDVVYTNWTGVNTAYIPTASVEVDVTSIVDPDVEIVMHGIMPTQDFLDQWVFQYTYDERQRMIEKKVPGADVVYMVYDQRDRLVLTQDGNQRSTNTWSFTKYDAFNRPVITGQKIIAGTATAIRTAVAAVTTYAESYDAAGLHKYTNVAYPTGIVDADVHTVTYYDSYQHTSKSFIDPPGGRFTTEDNKLLPVDFTSVKGQVTGTKTKVLGTNNYTETVNFYDDRYRLIQTQSTNHQTGDDVLTTQYDFAGRVRKTFLEFDNPNGDVTSATIAQNYTYDHAGRLLTVDHSIDGATAQIIVKNTYNELGELETKQLHDEGSSIYAQTVDYSYNMRGWLTQMNDPAVTDPATYFSMQLKYDNATTGHEAYNGNIGTIEWKNPLQTTTNIFDYDYDPVNRLTAADYGSATDYDINSITYDDNGNILTLQRNGQQASGSMGTIDNLSYTYASGNQLSKVEDAQADDAGFKDGVDQTTEYTYDNNGNMITDANKGIIDIDYNYLNLPEKVDMGGNNRIEYDYDAAGIKLQQRVYENNTLTKTTDYLGGFIYEDNVLQFVQHDEGRVIPPAQTPESIWEYQYHLKDHLGNTRISFTTEDRVTDYDATFEDANYTAENQHFYNLINRVTYPAPAGGKAQRLNSTDPVGAGISFGVVPGDVIDLSVKAYYTNTTGFGTTPITSGAFAGAVSSAFGGLNGGTETQQATYNIFTALGVVLLSGNNGTDDKPSAYLNYVVFDQNMVRNPNKSGYVGIGTGVNSEQTLSASNIEIDQAGFVYIYLSNESNSANYVYFDNLDVTINESRILEKSDYYPFGLTFNSYNKAGMIGQNFKYNSKELVTDLSLGWYDYQARWYDPALGRWHAVDPAADLMRRHSPYNYAFDNPIRYIDPDGMFPTNPLFNQALGELKSQFDFVVDKVEGAADAVTETVSDVVSGAGDKIEEGVIAFGEFLEENVPSVDVVVTDANNDGEYYENGPNPDIEVTKEDVEIVKTAVGGASKSKSVTLGGSEKRASSATGNLNETTVPKIDTVRTQHVDGNGNIGNRRIILQETDTLEDKYYVPDDIF